MRTLCILNIVGLLLLLILITVLFIWLLVSDYKRAKNGEKTLFWEAKPKTNKAKSQRAERK